MVQILSTQRVNQKIRRLAFEIYENHCEDEELAFIGINKNGRYFAQMLINQLKSITNMNMEIHFFELSLNPASPADSEISLNVDVNTLDGKKLILVDDVANSGRTLFYAAKPFLTILPKQLEVAVLVDRSHKSFPIQVDYVGLSLATTLSEHIQVNLQTEKAVYLV